MSGTGTSEPRFTEPWALETISAWRRAEQDADAAAWIAALMRFTHGPHRTRDDVETDVWQLVETMASQPLETHVRLDADGRPIPPVSPTQVTDTWARLEQIMVPVLAMSGAEDGDDHRRMGRQLAASVTQAPSTHLEIPGTAHDPNLERPEAFNAVISTWLREHRL